MRSSAWLSAGLSGLSALALSGPLAAQLTARVSVGSGGVEGDGATSFAFISPDGRWVCFESASTNLVPGDTNGVVDVFLHDLDTGAIELVSVGAGATLGNGACYTSSVSGDGRYVVFGSAASNLVPNDTNGVQDIFVRDRVAGTTERVSVDSNGNESHNPTKPYGQARFPRITPDGRYVVFNSSAVDLVPGDTNATADIFLHDRQTGQTELVSMGPGGVLGDGESIRAAISNDGRFIVFCSRAATLVPGDTNATIDIFLRDRLAGVTERVSVTSTGAQALGPSLDPSISADGRFVAYASLAANLVPGDTNGAWDIFVRDGQTGGVERVSVDSSGSEGNGPSLWPRISADGRYVSFESAATNLVAGDTNGQVDVFVHDRQSGLTERVSVSTSGAQGTSTSFFASISRDGRRVVFLSQATDLVNGDTNGAQDAFVRDRGPSIGSSFCSGDGSGAACPCANPSAPGSGAGCANSLGHGGLLVASGTPSVNADSVLLSASGMPDSSALYFQGTIQQNAGLGVSFGDGLRCAGGATIRLGLKSNVQGASHYPETTDPRISVQGAIAAGDVRTYQVWYRNADMSFCTSSTFNLTNGWQMTWQP